MGSDRSKVKSWGSETFFSAIPFHSKDPGELDIRVQIDWAWVWVFLHSAEVAFLTRIQMKFLNEFLPTSENSDCKS